MSEAVSPKNKKILIVEDNADIRALYKEVIEGEGYAVEEAADGLLALDLIKGSNWDLLLLDIMLPGKDGVKILKEIKETPGMKKGPVIALTNLNSDALIKEAFTDGADGYLIKSDITPDKILAEIASHLSKPN